MRTVLHCLALLLVTIGCGGEGSDAPPAPPSGSSTGESGSLGGDDDSDGESGDGDPSTGGDGDGDGDGDSPTGGDSIVGAWRHIVGDCTYTNTFDASGNYTIVSTSGERIIADYTFTMPSDPAGRYRVDYTIASDNNGVDCEGDMIDETGNRITLFIEFPTMTTADIFRNESGGGPAFSWQKI